MAEQEACASAVAEALESTGAGDVDGDAESVDTRGESLLLPLLQGLLSGGDKLLAGLGAAGADVLADVRRSLARLRAALAPPAPAPALPAAPALLALADRLEAALDAADRLDGCGRARRRPRAARHTVGVSHEELDAARRLVDRDRLDGLARAPDKPSDGCKLPTVADNAPAPADEGSTETFEAPKRRESTQKKPDHYRHSIADAPPRRPSDPEPAPSPYYAARNGRETRNGIAAIANKFNGRIDNEKAHPKRVPQKMAAPKIQQPMSPTREEFKRAPLYRPLPPSYNFAAPPAPEEPSRPLNRFRDSSKRGRMKRANTIDIPKPLGAYRLDSDTEDEGPSFNRRPAVPAFLPQTENDHKFIAFMQKNEDGHPSQNGGHSNWNNRFGNIKNTFESGGQDRSRSSSNSSAKQFWRSNDDVFQQPKANYGPRLTRKTLTELQNLHAAKHEAPKTPWSMEAKKTSVAPQINTNLPPIVNDIPPPAPTKPVVLKPFATKPIPMNQFSHAPMSAFKPPNKVTSPISAPAHIWSPPSTTLVSPQPTDNNSFSTPKSVPTSPVITTVPWASHDNEKPKRVQNMISNKFESNKFNSHVSAPFGGAPQTYKENNFTSFQTPVQQTYPQQNYPVVSIPSQNSLAAPELVQKVDNLKQSRDNNNYNLPKIDAQKSQIEFYEKQIRQKKTFDPVSNGYNEKPNYAKPPPLPAYTITNYTPPNVVSTFVPLQQTPDIEKAKAHKVDYLPDVVMNENNQYVPAYATSPNTRKAPDSPYNARNKFVANNQNVETVNIQKNKPTSKVFENGSEPTEYQTVTRVMKGPISQQATITTGVRTRNDDQFRGTAAAKSLKGVLQKFSSPKHEVLSQIERKKREQNGTSGRLQVQSVPAHPVNNIQNGYTPSPQPSPQGPSPVNRSVPLIKYNNVRSPPTRPIESPNYGKTASNFSASRESIYSNDSNELIEARSPEGKPPSPFNRNSVGSTPSPVALSKSESWHQIAERTKVSTSPRKVVSRAKSMHLLSVPKLFEGGIAKEEIQEKKRTVEAYFTGNASPNSLSKSGSQRSVAEAPEKPTAKWTHATHLKARSSKSSSSYSLGRSRTMPTVSELQFLDESNADDAFEDLVSALA